MAALVENRTVTVFGKTFQKKTTSSYENVGASIDNKSLAAGRKGSVTTRSSASVATITLTTSPSGYIATNDEVGIGWYDANGVFRIRMNVTVSVSGSVLTTSLGGGEDLPATTTIVYVGYQFTEVISSDTSPILISTAHASSRLGVLIANAADIATPTYANALFLSAEGVAGGGNFLLNTTEITASNSNYVTGNRALIANLSEVATTVNVLPMAA